jgi:glycosyltransferase involved in cell wall biosynthesis
VGGAAVHTYNLVKSLTKIGVDCKVLAFGDPTYSNAEVTFLEPKSSIVYRCNCPLKNDLKIPLDILRIARFANRLIKTENFDIVHVEEPYVGSFVRHKRKITTVHDTSYGDIKSLASTGAHFANFKRILFYLSMGFFFEFTCIASSSLVITPSKQIKHELTDIYRTSRDKVLVLRSGVNLPDLPSVIDKHAAKKKLGLPEDELLVFTTSQHIPRKRLETLLFAVSLFNKEQEGYKVVIAGDGPSHDILLNQAKKLGLDEVVVFPG